MNRDNLLNKIRALMSKTVDNGCSEYEALAALDKARAMMDAYEVTDADLQLTKEQSAILHNDNNTRDPHGIKASMAMAVARFCDCKVWKSRGGGFTFCGLPTDAQFASWLTDTLGTFVQGELAGFLMGRITDKAQRQLMINGFVGGATTRISQRLDELTAQSKVVASNNSRALVVAKASLISDAMSAAGINLGRARASRRSVDMGALNAGKAAGDRASFGRPVGGASVGKISCK